MPSPRQILQRMVDKSGLSLRAFAASRGQWDHAYLVRTLDGKYAMGPAVVGRLLVHLDEKEAAELITAYLEEQKRLIEEERRRFAKAKRAK